MRHQLAKFYRFVRHEFAGLNSTIRRLPTALAIPIFAWLVVGFLDTDAGSSGDYDNLFIMGFMSVVMLPWLLWPALEERKRWMHREGSSAYVTDGNATTSPARRRSPGQ